MLLIQDQKSEVEPIRGLLELDESGDSDLPPAYDALSIHQSTSRAVNQSAGRSAFPEHVAGPSKDSSHSGSTSLNPPALRIDKSLPPPPSSPHNPSSPNNTSLVPPQRPHARKNASWLSLLPFASSFSAKRVRQSVLSVVSDLAVPPSRVSSEEQKNVHEILASAAETCAEYKLSLSTILQEMFVADHTPMYWAVVNYRQELLVALLAHSRPLSVPTISDIRRACLASSNQALFHALRVCRPPFQGTDGIRVQSLRTASENLLLNNRPSDDVRIQQANDQGFVVSFNIPLWQKRMKVIGQVNVEFIASGRMWSIAFFSLGPPSTIATFGKSKQGTNAWHVMISLLESSPPTFFDSQLIVDAPSSSPPGSDPIQTRRLREVRSTMFPHSHNVQHQDRPSTYEYNYDGNLNSRSSQGRNALTPSETDRHSSSSLSRSPPPTHPMRGSSPPISIPLGCGNRKLAFRSKSGELSEHTEKPTIKLDTWSDHGVSYTNAVVSSLGHGPGSRLLHDHSPYLSPDGTLSGRLEARFVWSKLSKDCIIC